MKLRPVSAPRLRPARRRIPSFRVQSPPAPPASAEQERLFRSIERTQGFLHRHRPSGPFMALLRRRYPTPKYFIESSRRSLERAGVPRLDAHYYAMIPALTRTALSQQWGPNPRLDALCRLREYITTLYVGVHVECFYVLLLDRQGRLIRSVLLQKGGVDSAPFYLGQLLTVALQEQARFLVLVHNHPSGTRRPSREDLQCTLRTINAFMPLQIPLLDHVILAGDALVSIRQAGWIPEMLWMAASPGSRIPGQWLREEPQAPVTSFNNS